MVELGEWVPLVDRCRLPAMPGIYIVRHIKSGLEYVGKSVNVRKRLYYHIRAKIDDTYFYRAIQRHGAEAFEVCWYMAGSPEELSALEVLLIEERGTFSPGGYNTTIGGEGVSGRKATPEQREALSRRMRGTVVSENTKELTRRSCLIAAAALRGIPRTEEVKARMRAGNAKRTYGPRGPMTAAALASLKSAKKGAHVGAKNPRAKAVGAWAPEAMVPLVFPTSQDAANYFGLPLKKVGRWCNQGHQPTGAHSHAFAYL